MATAHSPKIVTDNLEICLDPKDPNSLSSTSSTTIKSTGRKLSNGAPITGAIPVSYTHLTLPTKA